MGATVSKKVVNGKEVDYADVIHNTVRTKFGFKDRFKILFGREVCTQNLIYTEQECSPVGTETKVTVANFFKKRVPLMVAKQ